MSDAKDVIRFQKKYAQIAGQDFQFIRKSAFMAKRGRKAPKPERDLRSPEEIAEWKQICLASNEMQKRAKAPPPPKPFDLWSYDTAHLLDELAGIREIILRVPITLQTKSALQSAVDRIWRVEEDVRFLLSLQRDMQASFAQRRSAPGRD